MSRAADPDASGLQRSVARLLRAVRLRATGRATLSVAPGVVGLLWLLARVLGSRWPLWAICATGVTLTVAVAALLARNRHTAGRLVRRVDRLLPEAEDSTALALQALPATGLRALQQARVRQRLTAALRDPVTRRRLQPTPGRVPPWAAAVMGGCICAVALVLPRLPAAWSVGTRAAAVRASPGATAVADARLTITAPTYTGIAERSVSSLDAEVPADSRVVWAVTLDRSGATAAALVFDDGSRIPLQADGGNDGRRWRGSRTVATSALYRIELTGVPPLAGAPLHRIDAVPDTPPAVTVRQPSQTLNLAASGQTTWELAFDAQDDHGLGAAVLTVRLAQGTGEQIKVTEQRIPLDGGNDAHRRSYRRTLDLAQLGYTKGDDLIVQLDVADNHAPQPQHGSSANVILRWPAEAQPESLGLEGLVQTTTPAYFRSERQIIIDTEALLADHATMAASAYAARADAIGVDQKVLRLRYGEFLGEGFESNAERAPPGASPASAASAAAAHPSDVGAGAGADADARAQAALKTRPPEAEAGGQTPARPGVGTEGHVLGEFGHLHDQAEAATLLDPQTRRLLKDALDAMWQAELHLRQAELERALPFENRALDAIKQVQQAERIYLARAGQNLPEVDPARRLSGERAGLTDRVQALPPPAPAESPAPAVWAALAHGEHTDLTALMAWVRRHPDAAPDPLGLIAAADRLQRAPDCADCRQALQGKLWALLPLAPTAIQPRALPDAVGAAYLDALKPQPAGAAR